MPGKAVLWRALIKWCMFSCTDAYYNLHNHEEPHHDKTNKMMCAQQRLRSAWASAQSDQSLPCLHEETLGP